MRAKKKYKGLYILSKEFHKLIYPDYIKEQINEYVTILAPPFTKNETAKYAKELSECEVVFSGWGSLTYDEQLLALMPNLKILLYGAGSVKGVVTDAFWDKEIQITSAYGANAIPVAEYTVSQLLFALKDGYRMTSYLKKHKKYPNHSQHYVHGCFKSIVGIVSLGMIGRKVCEHLKHFDIDVIAYDPFVDESVFEELNAEKINSLEEIFMRADAISLHTPWLPQTEGMITEKHFISMKENGIFINTSRGAVVRENDMIKVLQMRPDIFAILDVTYPEPAESNSLLYSLPNVVLTPHIAGTMGRECARMGLYMVDEIKRWYYGEPLKYAIDRKKAQLLA